MDDTESINMKDSFNKANIETIVENWLNENKSWFSSYAIENLDMSTVDKWLRINGKRICKCKSLGGSLSSTNSISFFSKSNSIASSTFKNSSSLVLNINNFNLNSNNNNNNSINSNTNNSNKKSNSFLTPQNECSKKYVKNLTVNRTSSKENFMNQMNKKLNIFKGIHRSSSLSCILHRRKLIHLNNLNTNDQSQCLFSFNEEGSINESKPNSNSLRDVQSSSNTPKTKLSNDLTADFNEEEKNPINSLEILASNLLSFRRNSLQQHSFTYHSYDSATSSNLLKFLIKSKIKLPTCFSKITEAEKIKLKKEKNNDLEFVLELIKDTISELNLNQLSQRIINNLKVLVNAEKVFLYFLCKSRQGLSTFKFEPISRYPNISQETLNEVECDPEQESFLEKKLIATVAQTGNIIHLPNANQDSRLIDQIKDDKIKSIVCMPIRNIENEIVAVAQIINKSSSNGKSSSEFTENDIYLLKEYLKFCGVSISHSQLFDLYAYEYERNRSLLEVIHELFEQQTNLDIILFRIMQKAQTLLKCQRCSILVILDNDNQQDDFSSRKAFDLFQNGKESLQRRHSVENDDGTKISRDLADHVIITGEKINLEDAYLDPRFDPLVDTVWSFKTKGILCMPIYNREGSIIGCAQVANRIDNHPFDDNDEQLFEAFCIFCGLAINNTIIYHELEKSMAEKSVALEVLSYHATCSKNELNIFIDKLPPDENFTKLNKTINKENLKSYVFNDFSLNINEMVIASYEMFKASGLMKTFQIEKKTLFQWLLTVRKNYRDVEYHNFSHAFNVCQTMFSIFENSSLSGYLQDIEKLALIVGCLCHDLDHRGTNNMFQVETHSALSQLYGTTATMEKHHFNHCVMILNTPGHNIFAHVKPRTYELLISYIKEAILATDLADHFSIRKDFEEATRTKDVCWNEEPYCSLLRKHLMTCCDLAAVAKPWNIHKNVVDLVTKEFFAQGDRERLELNKEPNEMMDARRSHELPRLQMGWIDNVCMPLYSNVACLCNSFKDHLIRIADNRRKWSLLNEQTRKKLFKFN